MKGVSAVIAIILILMIVVALAALAYTWFTGIFATLTQTAGTAVTTTTGQMATQFRIEAASCTGTCVAGETVSFTIRNTGTQTFDRELTDAYVDGIHYEPTPTGSGDLGSGGTETYTLTTGEAHTCDTSVVAVTIATGLRDSRIIIC